jgi:nucleotide-binding universal stress UspA family protein
MIPRNILLCTDFSPNSEPARQIAVDYAGAFGADLIILHVIDWSTFPLYIDWAPDELDRILQRSREAAQIRLRSIAEEASTRVKNVRFECRVGLAANCISDTAGDESADLIVLGTHGRSGLKQLVMGSVARSLLKVTKKPVLIIQGPSDEGDDALNRREFPLP